MLRLPQTLALAVTLAPLAAAQIDVGSFDASRGRALSTSGTLGYDTLRAALTAASFDAATGCTVNIAAETGAVTAAYLADKEVFFVGDGNGSVTTAEGSALATWHAAGGLLILVSDTSTSAMANSVLAAIGSPSSLGGSGCSSGASVSSISSPITDGPFGDATGGTYGTTLGSALNLGGSASALVSCTDGVVRYAGHAAGTVNGANSGGVLFMGDVNWMDYFTDSGNFNYDPNNLVVALNTFARACPDNDCEPLDLGGFDGSRGRPFSSTGLLGYELLSDALTNPANFGPNGTVCCPVNIAPETGAVTAGYLADKEIFFAGDSTDSVSAAEAAALDAWHAAGGTLILVSDTSTPAMANSILAAIGSPISLAASGCSLDAFITSADNPISNGPFGDVRGGSYGTTLGGSITGGIALVTCADSVVRFAGHAAGGVNGPNSGGVFVLSDVNWMTTFLDSGSGNYDANNLIVALNTIATACSGGSGSDDVTVICDPASNHTQGNYTKLDNSTLGAAGGGNSGLHLEATDGPSGEFGYFLVSSGASNSLAVSNGILCLDNPQGRYAPAAGASLNSIGQFNGAGVYQSVIQAQQGWDVPTALPSPPGGSIAAGSTWYFQMWYRDGQRSNFSNAISVQF